MLIIDDNMFKLAKMQETLLTVSTSNREENLKNYKKTVMEIDAKAYEGILDEIKHIDEHNQSLEEELQFLEKIKVIYNQLLELQLRFKNVCEKCNDTELKLTDLSRLNIEYIENRINAISGYLINLKNIEDNKLKLEKLNENLVNEEKQKIVLDNRLLSLEEELRNNFYNAEGRFVVDGNLQYTNVVSEYEKIGLDLRKLVEDNTLLNDVLSETEKEKNDVSEKVRAAELCYNSILSSESRQVLNEINAEFLRIKYKLVMLKITELLTKNVDEYTLFIKKRQDILNLIKSRLSCMEQLGMRLSIDPFSRTKVKEQLDMILSFEDNSKDIDRIRKEISRLNTWTEEMLSQNNNYLITLSETRNLIDNNIGLSDIDITSVVSFDEIMTKREISENQVVSVKAVPSKINIVNVNKKTDGVIKRVNQMMNGDLVDDKKQAVDVIPELVIVPTDEEIVENIEMDVIPTFEPYQVSNVETETDISLDNSAEQIPLFEDVILEDKDNQDELKSDVVFFGVDSDEDIIESNNENLNVEEVEEIKDDVELPVESTEISGGIDSDIFETIKPFNEPSLFMDRAEVANVQTEDVEFEPLDIDKIGETSIQIDDSTDEMPEAFWVTSSATEEVVDDVNENQVSFDEQINALLNLERDDSGKTKKRVA